MDYLNYMRSTPWISDPFIERVVRNAPKAYAREKPFVWNYFNKE